MKKVIMCLMVSMLLIGTGFIVAACYPNTRNKPHNIYVAKPYSSNCGPDHYPLVVDGFWDTWEWCSLGDTLYFNYTINQKAKAATWHYGYWEAEGQGHINESMQIPMKYLHATGHDRLVHLRVQLVDGECWWGDEWIWSIWDHKTRSWVMLQETHGGQDGSYYDTGITWVIR